MKRILVTDDDIYIGDLLEKALLREGYCVKRAYSGTEALMLIQKESFDLILLDLMLPGLSGEELLPKIKDIPVIAVSAKADVSDKVRTLLCGADDYITKPFELSELLARVAVSLRRSETVGAANVLRFDDLTLFADTHTVKIAENEVRLTRTECAILRLLMQNPKNPVSRSAILDRISLDTPDCTERSLKQHISNIRHKLQAVSGKDYIEAVYGIGFKMRS
ncbi:MAG: response regulator transcription factor [Oscillospiraceae bacterium]